MTRDGNDWAVHQAREGLEVHPVASFAVVVCQ